MEAVELYPPLVMSGGSDFQVCSVNFPKNKFRETPKLEVGKSVASVVAKTSSAKTIPSRVILSDSSFSVAAQSVGVHTTKVYWPAVTMKALLHSGMLSLDQKQDLFR